MTDATDLTETELFTISPRVSGMPLSRLKPMELSLKFLPQFTFHYLSPKKILIQRPGTGEYLKGEARSMTKEQDPP